MLGIRASPTGLLGENCNKTVVDLELYRLDDICSTQRTNVDKDMKAHGLDNYHIF